MKLLSIDPGTKNVGVAVFEDGILVKALCSRSKRTMMNSEYLKFHLNELKDLIFLADEVVVEKMVYRPGDSRSHPNSLLEVQMVGAGLAGAVRGPVHALEPRVWKSPIPKSVHHLRMRSAMGSLELEILDASLKEVPKNNEKEILDAVGIGLFHLKRIRKDGSRPRR